MLNKHIKVTFKVSINNWTQKVSSWSQLKVKF